MSQTDVRRESSLRSIAEDYGSERRMKNRRRGQRISMIRHVGGMSHADEADKLRKNTLK